MLLVLPFLSSPGCKHAGSSGVADAGKTVGEAPEVLFPVEYFEDVRWHPQERFIRELAERGIVDRSMPRFEPDSAVSAADFSAWGTRLFGRPSSVDKTGERLFAAQAAEMLAGWGAAAAPTAGGEGVTRAAAAELLLRAWHDPARRLRPLKEGTLYVSTQGNDAWSGRLPEPNAAKTDGPLATPRAARDRVRQLRRDGLTGAADVLFRGGAYRLDETLDFGPEDCATTYRSYGHEPVIWSGGRRLAAWEEAESREASVLWRGVLPSGLPPVRQLTLGAQGLPRARFPEQGYAEIVAVDNVEFPKRLQLDLSLPAGRVLSPHAEVADLAFWSTRRERIARSGPDWVEGVTHLGLAPWRLTVAQAGNPCFLENDPSFLTKPWHWSLSEAGDAILLLLPAGRQPADLDLVVPALERLVRIEGTESDPVRDLRFQGLALLHAAATLPARGISELQATFFNDRLSENDQPGRVDRLYSLPAAIDVSYASGIEFLDLRLAHLGNQGINFGAGSRFCRLEGSEVAHIGATGVMVGGREVWGEGAASEHPQAGRGDWSRPAQVPYGNTVSDNIVRDCGEMIFGAVGIWVGYTKMTTVSWNEVYHLPYSGISVGWAFHSRPSSMESPLIEFNHVHETMRVMTDGGGIYLLGRQPGGVMRGNVVHGQWRNLGIRGYFAHGLYFDEASRFWRVENNHVFDNFHDLKLNNYLRNLAYEYVDENGGIIDAAERIGGADWIDLHDNKFGVRPDEIVAGPRDVFRERLSRPSPARAAAPLFVKADHSVVSRIPGERAIGNPGFEQPGLGGWRLLEGWGRHDAESLERVVDPSSAAAGRAFLRLQRRKPHDPVLSTGLALEDGKTYRLKASVRLADGSCGQFRVYIESLGREIISGVKLEPGRWIDLDATFTMDNTLHSHLAFQSLDPASGTGPIDFDEVSVTEEP